MIWPDGTDQVFMANQLDVVHGLAVELVQIRKGEMIPLPTVV